MHLFEHPGAATLEEATALHGRLSATAAAPNAKFLALAQALIKRFPVEVGGTVDGQPLWLESVPDGETGGTAVYSLGLYDGGQTQLLPALVGLALPMGLCVYDEQAGRCYLPGGWALTVEGRRPLRPRATPVASMPAAGAAPSPLTTAWVRGRLREVLGPALARAGFGAFDVQHSLRFTRATEAGLQHIHLTLTAPHDSIVLVPSASLEPELPHALYRTVRMDELRCQAHSHDALAPHGMALQTPNWGPHLVFCNLTRHTGAEVEALLPVLLGFVQSAYLPLLDACRDVPGIVRCCLAPQDWPAYPIIDRLALALVHWTGQVDVQAALEAELARSAPHPNHHPGVLRTCAERLAALPAWRGQWRPSAIPPRRLPQPDDRLPPQVMVEQLWPRLCALAEARGFAAREEEPRRFVLRRVGADVGQTLRFDFSNATKAAVAFGPMAFDCPAVSAYLRQFLAPWAPPRNPGHGWPAVVALKPGSLEHLGIDPRDLSFSVERKDRFEDHAQAAEASLVQHFDLLLDRTQTLAALAAVMAHAQSLPDWSHGNSRYGFEEAGCLLLLAAVFVPERLEPCIAAARARFKYRGWGFFYDQGQVDMLERVIAEAQRLAADGSSPPFVGADRKLSRSE